MRTSTDGLRLLPSGQYNQYQFALTWLIELPGVNSSDQRSRLPGPLGAGGGEGGNGDGGEE